MPAVGSRARPRRHHREIEAVAAPELVHHRVDEALRRCPVDGNPAEVAGERRQPPGEERLLADPMKPHAQRAGGQLGE